MQVISLGTNDCKFDVWTDKDDVKEKYKALMGTIMDKKPGVKAVFIAYAPPLLRKDKKWDIECIRSPQEVRGVVNDVHSWFRDTYSRRADRPLMNRGDAAAATWILLPGDKSRRRRGRDVDITPWR